MGKWMKWTQPIGTEAVEGCGEEEVLRERAPIELTHYVLSFLLN